MKKFLQLLLALSLALFGLQLAIPQLSYSAALGVPTNVVVRTSTDAPYLNASLTVTWDEVESATAYAVIATRAGTSTISTAAVSGKKNTQAVISGLLGGVTYVVQVRTIENVNFSDWSSASLTATPTTLPKQVDKPTAIPSVGSATVNWTALVGNENGGSSITSYVITETNSGKSISATSSASTIEFTGLDQGVGAIFTVTALTAISTTGSVSTASDEVTITSADDGRASPTATPTASPTATPTASATATPTASPSSSSTSGSGGGGFGGGGGGFGGAEDTATASASPSASPSKSGSPAPSPTASKSPSPSPSAVIASDSASPSVKPSVVCTTAKPVTKGRKGVVTCITTYPKGSTGTKPSVKCVTEPSAKKGAKSVVTCSTIAPSKKPSTAPSKKPSTAPSKKATTKASTNSVAKRVTITCVKGKTTLNVTAVKPSCPKGYTKK